MLHMYVSSCVTSLSVCVSVWCHMHHFGVICVILVTRMHPCIDRRSSFVVVEENMYTDPDIVLVAQCFSLTRLRVQVMLVSLWYVSSLTNFTSFSDTSRHSLSTLLHWHVTSVKCHFNDVTSVMCHFSDVFSFNDMSLK